MIDTKLLREKVLDLAIRGKLVPQDPNDEPASVLLERIRAQKEQMVKEGKLKAKDIKDDTIIFKGEDNLHYEKFSDGTVKCIQDEIPFELPPSWSWCRLNTLSAAQINSFVDGPFGSNLKTEHYTRNREVRIIQLNNIGNFIWKNTGVKYTTFKHAETLERCKTYPNDIVIAKMMPAGRAIIVPPIESVYLISSDCVRLRVADSIDNKYIMFAINSPIVNAQIQESVHGIGRSRTSLSKCKTLLIPIPPILEQSLICKSIESIFSLLVTVETTKSELSRIISSLKSNVLDLAIRGKLVPQNPDNEPAAVLLERIRAEKEELIKQGKLKRDKKESVIFKGDDNSYYEKIPANWTSCKLGVLCNISNGYAFESKKFSSEGIPIVRISDITNSMVKLDNSVHWDKKIDEKFIVRQGDLLIALSGATTGKMGVYKYDFPAYLNQRIGNVRVKDKNILLENYRDIFLMAMQDVILDNAYGAAQPNISSKQIEDLHILLPPLAEQKRIVEAIETIFAQLDKITNSIS